MFNKSRKESNVESENQIKNQGLFKLHRLFFIAFISFSVILAMIGIINFFKDSDEATIGLFGIALIPGAALHWYAAKGAKLGLSYGKTLSRIVGTLWLFGFPVGTALGIYVWYQTTKKWSESTEVVNRA